tara:strand:- start:21092 stop:23002 length:1911 start_codon:yes stop_codon:yes gene_type:complete
MPFTKYTNLDFDQIKASIKDYLRSNSTFTDFDFEGSNFSILIDTLAYNTYITAFNSNLIVNESFLESATLRENVVSLARSIGYVPKSRTCSDASISFTATTTSETSTVTLKAGLVCTGTASDTSYVFSIPEDTSASVIDGVATFSNLTIKEGTLLKKQFVYDGSLDQRFVLNNSFIDTSTIRVYVKSSNETGLGRLYTLVENIFDVNKFSEIFLIQEVKDEKYEILFGDDIFGKKLSNGDVITVTYLVTNGKDGNGANNFSFSGSIHDENDSPLITTTSALTTLQASQNGSDIETIDSIKNYAPRLYSSQYRAVTASDYETIIKSKIYPQTESVSVIGGEELDPPEFGKVFISIKPKNGTYVSDLVKDTIKNKLKLYSVSGISPEIIDLKVLYVEIDTSVYFDNSKIANANDLKSRVTNSLTKYAESTDLNSFGGRFKYSKIQQVIDNTDEGITSNITKVVIRRDLKALMNTQAQYEICFGNKFHVNPNGRNIKSTGFNILGENSTVYITDIPNADLKTGTIAIVRDEETDSSGNSTTPIIVQGAGTVDYEKGEVILNTVIITNTVLDRDTIEIQAFPESNDVVGLKDLYLSFSVNKSKINIVKDVIASGDDKSGVIFTSENYYRSSYSNGEIKRL